MGTFIIYTDTPSIQVAHTAQFWYANATGSVTWTSSNPEVATIDSASGLMTGVSQSDSPVTITGTDAGPSSSTATARVWVGNLAVSPQTASSDPGNTVDLTVSGAVGTVAWSSSVTKVATIDAGTGRATVESLGATIIKATDSEGNIGYATLRGGTLLVYGADGTLFLVPPKLWAVASFVPPEASGVPSFKDMNEPPWEPPTSQVAVYRPPSTAWTTCYVLNPSPVTPRPSSDKKKV